MSYTMVTTSNKLPCPEPDQSRFTPTMFFKIYLNTILPSSSRSSKWLSSHLVQDLPNGFSPSRLPTKSFYAPLLSPIRATCPAYIVLALITRNTFGEEYKSFAWFPSWFRSVPLDKLWDKISHLERTASSLTISNSLLTSYHITGLCIQSYRQRR